MKRYAADDCHINNRRNANSYSYLLCSCYRDIIIKMIREKQSVGL